MNTDQNVIAYDELMKLLEADDEEGAKKYLTDHVNEFSDEVQQKIVALFFKEALSASAAKVGGDSSVAGFQNMGMDALRGLEKEKKVLDNASKQFDLRQDLGI